MAERTPANLRAWASAPPEELRALEAEDALYKQDATLEEDEDIAGEMLPVSQPSDPDFDPEEIETYAYEISDQLNDGEGDDELIALVDEYDPADGIPAWVADEELWDGAQDVASDVVQPTDPTYWQLVVHLYSYMQGVILEPEVAEPEEIEPEEAELKEVTETEEEVA